MRIVVGTYDGALLGWETDASDASGRSLRLAYAFGAHDSAIKALAIDEAKGNTLVTGCGDETMRVYSLKHHREVGTLNVHTDAVGTLSFFGGSNLLSASRDGGVCIWRTTDWTNLEVMRGHKAAVNGVSIHPSGRLALTVGADKALRLWDLTKGRPAFTAPLPTEPLGVKWSDDGTLFAVLHEGGVTMHDGATGAQVRTLSPPAGTRLLDMTLFTAPGSGKGAPPVNVVAVGCEGGDVRLWEAGGAWCRVLPTGHARRVRCVAYTDAVKPVAAPSAASAAAAPADAAAPNVDLHPLSKMSAAASARVTLSQPGPFLVTVDSEATVKLWHVPGLLAASAGGKGAASASGDFVLSGIEPAATLKTGSPARATALAATRLRTRAQSEMKGHAGAPSAAAAAAAPGGKPVKPPQQQQGGGKKEKQHHQLPQAAGLKRPRAPEDGDASAAAPHPPKGKHQGSSAPAAQPAAAAAPFAFGFKINAKQRPLPAAAPEAAPSADGEAAAAAAPPVTSGEQPPAGSKKSKHQPQPQGADGGAGGGKKGDAKGKGVRFAV